jgi:recombinational DNA repair protein (RecF pathway)
MTDQRQAFNEVTLECDRCRAHVPLAHIEPTVRGFVCRRCLVKMPSHEFRALLEEERG